jgi:hypothetical protein
MSKATSTKRIPTAWLLEECLIYLVSLALTDPRMTYYQSKALGPLIKKLKKAVAKP